MTAIRSRAIAIFENNYHFSVLKRCVRIDPESGHLLDKALILTIMNSLKFYFEFPTVDDFYQQLDRDTQVEFRLDLLFRNKSHPYKIRISNYILVLLTFCIDYFIEREEADSVLLTVQNIR